MFAPGMVCVEKPFNHMKKAIHFIPRLWALCAALLAAGAEFSTHGQDGKVIVWGSLGVPNGVTNAIDVSGGRYHALGLFKDGTVAGWGENGYGQINIPAIATNVIAISAGGWHNLALRADGSLVTWGTQSQPDLPPEATNI